ncbi:FKBP-type peptidyl-prolyl cis-trans isomerase [Geomobilimonas luticola]|uniref:Peptidyl-prolyl cis-trans isomerase n=1 Tax=Geomobilimonas luticola TaxID=1114878 RepID=A0ABS5S9P7_9BACT|nr:FKBP-type peptidyl-prolyl cis-trans isomerase [Geomobilimonas luticola]MBT0652104.1 FKBP-type peptidyl-prolyl cis-trans isomerase [Geomobilimonas luticola]
MIRLMTIVAVLVLTVAVCRAEERAPLADKKAKDSYSLGYDFGNNLRTQEVNLDENVLITAIHEALEGKAPAMKPDEMRDNLKQLRKEVLIRYNLRSKRQAANTKEEGTKFLAVNKSKEGVTTLPSGLQYAVLKEGDGPRPQASDRVKVNYRGTLVDGTEFDSSFGPSGPATVRVDDVIKGWTEALQLMKTGAKWQLFVPAELAYGTRQFGRIPPNSTLIFEVELLAIEREADSRGVEQKPATEN